MFILRETIEGERANARDALRDYYHAAVSNDARFPWHWVANLVARQISDLAVRHVFPYAELAYMYEVAERLDRLELDARIGSSVAKGESAVTAGDPFVTLDEAVKS